MLSQLLPVEAEDGTALASTYIHSFADDPYTKCLFPTAKSADRIRDVASRHLEKFGDPKICYFKVIDPATNQVVSYSKWNMPAFIKQGLIREGMAKKPDYFRPGMVSDPEGLNDSLAVSFTEQIAEAHIRTIGEKPYISLDMLGTLPEYRGQGAGAKHVQLGRELAEKYDTLCVVDASPSSVHLCTKLGFREEETVKTDLSRWGGDGISTFKVMVYRPRGL